MAKRTSIFVLAAAAAVAASAAAAQTSAFTNQNMAADQVEDIQDDIEDAAERDTFTFGNTGRQVGSWGSVSLRLTDSDVAQGNDTTDLGIGANYGWYDGVNGQEINLAYVYGETNGVEDKNSLTAGYDYTRDINQQLFGYASLDLAYDNLATGTSVRRDALIGFGVGYRIIEDAQTDWAVKAGPGYRYIEFGNDDEENEVAYMVESNYAYAFSEDVTLTNDTTLIGSDSDTRVVNDLAVAVGLNDSLALRTSYTSEYGGEDLGSLDKVENLLGVSVVYNF